MSIFTIPLTLLSPVWEAHTLAYLRVEMSLLLLISDTGVQIVVMVGPQILRAIQLLQKLNPAQ
ncbi:MAG TPA: hypothetical protein VF896_01400 [Anaerolineales bacterium]